MDISTFLSSKDSFNSRLRSYFNISFDSVDNEAIFSNHKIDFNSSGLLFSVSSFFAISSVDGGIYSKCFKSIDYLS